MSQTPTNPDDVTAPAADARLFRSSPTWLFVIVVLLTLPTNVGLQLLLQLLDGAPAGSPQAAEALPSALAFAVMAGGAAAWLLWRRRTWVRISSGGIELAALGGDPILLDWSEIVAVRVRGHWLRTVLDVVPVALHAVRSAEPARDLPRVRDTADGAAFSVDVGALRPGPATLRAELARHTARSATRGSGPD
ncbi:MAG TPA: hypothetical protein VK453_01630 [Micromonosporaceae bacterium]|nr:hypothetical protein [Micromonosporaceae bacterium]